MENDQFAIMSQESKEIINDMQSYIDGNGGIHSNAAMYYFILSRINENNNEQNLSYLLTNMKSALLNESLSTEEYNALIEYGICRGVININDEDHIDTSFYSNCSEFVSNYNEENQINTSSDEKADSSSDASEATTDSSGEESNQEGADNNSDEDKKLDDVSLDNSSKNIVYHQDESNDLMGGLSSTSDNEIAQASSKTGSYENIIIQNLTDETRNNLPNLNSLFNVMRDQIKGINRTVQTIESTLRKKSNEINAEDSDLTGSSSGGGGSQEIEPQEPTIINQHLISSAVGIVTFATITPLYTKLGDLSTVNSSETIKYGLLGIEKYNDGYYFKIIDSSTGNIYYVETQKATIDTEITEFLEVKSSTVKLNELIESESGNATFIENGIYLGKERNTIEGFSGEFMKVYDSVDGKDYYIPIDENVEIRNLADIRNNNISIGEK